MPLEIGNRRGVVILDTFCHFGPNFAKISKPCADNTNFISLWDCLLHTNFPLNTLNSDFFVKAKLYAVLDCFTISKKDLVIKTKDQIKKLNSSCVSIDAKDEIDVYSSGSVAGSISIEQFLEFWLSFEVFRSKSCPRWKTENARYFGAEKSRRKSEKKYAEGEEVGQREGRP